MLRDIQTVANSRPVFYAWGRWWQGEAISATHYAHWRASGKAWQPHVPPNEALIANREASHSLRKRQAAHLIV